ncbi:hypothetical protein [Burkholderia pseudomallei]|uniref:hypothetical protein n=1 Tax=Burkholderia pseudomallei TaxID=28450 RepID=UPI0013923432|nr:hypothetical protein [Burkholderia pseudomallei]
MEVRASAGLAVTGDTGRLISTRRHLYEQRGIRFANLELSKKCPDSRFGKVLYDGICNVGLTQRPAR